MDSVGTFRQYVPAAFIPFIYVAAEVGIVAIGSRRLVPVASKTGPPLNCASKPFLMSNVPLLITY